MVGFSDILGGIFSPIKDIVSEVVVDKDKRDQVNLELKRLEDQAQARIDALPLGQLEVNKVEAANGSIFVAGWRPAVGWVGAAGLAWTAVLQPIVSWTAAVVFDYKGGFPVLNGDILLYTLGGMLGLGGMRTFEKVRGVATNDYQVQPTVAPSSNVEVDTKKGTVSVETTPASSPTPAQKRAKLWKF